MWPRNSGSTCPFGVFPCFIVIFSSKLAKWMPGNIGQLCPKCCIKREYVKHATSWAPMCFLGKLGKSILKQDFQSWAKRYSQTWGKKARRTDSPNFTHVQVKHWGWQTDETNASSNWLLWLKSIALPPYLVAAIAAAAAIVAAASSSSSSSSSSSGGSEHHHLNPALPLGPLRTRPPPKENPVPPLWARWFSQSPAIQSRGHTGGDSRESPSDSLESVFGSFDVDCCYIYSHMIELTMSGPSGFSLVWLCFQESMSLSSPKCTHQLNRICQQQTTGSSSLRQSLGECQGIARKGVRTTDPRKTTARNGSNAAKTAVGAPGLSAD